MSENSGELPDADAIFSATLDRFVLEYVIVAQAGTQLSRLHQLIGQYHDSYRLGGLRGLGLGDLLGGKSESSYLVEMILQMTAESVLQEMLRTGQIGSEKGELQQFQHLFSIPRTCWKKSRTWRGAFEADISDLIDQKFEQLKDSLEAEAAKDTTTSPDETKSAEWMLSLRKAVESRLQKGLVQMAQCLRDPQRFESFVLNSPVHELVPQQLRKLLPKLLPIIRPKWDRRAAQVASDGDTIDQEVPSKESNTVWEFAYAPHGEWLVPESDQESSATTSAAPVDSIEALAVAKRRIQAVQKVLAKDRQATEDDVPLWRDGVITFTRLARAYLMSVAPAWPSVQKAMQLLASESLSDDERRTLEGRIIDFGEVLRESEPSLVAGLALASSLGRLSAADSSSQRWKVGLEALDKWVPAESFTWEDVASRFAQFIEELPAPLNSAQRIEALNVLGNHDRSDDFDYSILGKWVQEDSGALNRAAVAGALHRSFLKVVNHLFSERASTRNTNPSTPEEITPYLVCESAGVTIVQWLDPSHARIPIGDWSKILITGLDPERPFFAGEKIGDATFDGERFSSALPLWVATIALRRLGFFNEFLAELFATPLATRIRQKEDEDWNRRSDELSLNLTHNPGDKLFQEICGENPAQSVSNVVLQGANSPSPTTSNLMFSLIVSDSDQGRSRLATLHPVSRQPCVCLSLTQASNFIRLIGQFELTWKLRDVYWENPRADQSPSDLNSLVSSMLRSDSRIIAVYRETPSHTKFPWNRRLPRRLSELLSPDVPQ